MINLEYIIGVTIVLIILRSMIHRRLELKYKYTVYSLRDDLRSLAIDGKIDVNDWLFHYTDNALSFHVRERKYNSLFMLVLLAVKHTNDKTYLNTIEKIKMEAKRNPEISNILERFNSAHQDYIIKQHTISLNVLILPILAPFNIVNRVSVFVKDAFFMPEVTPKYQV